LSTDELVDPQIVHFAARVRWLRESFYWRVFIRQHRAPAVKSRLSALAVVKCLDGVGYSTSSGSYSEIESGRIIPRDVDGFLLAFQHCLQLDDDMINLLREDLTYDIISDRLGKSAADKIVIRSTRVGQVLRQLRERSEQPTAWVEERAKCLVSHGFRPGAVALSEHLADSLEKLMRDEPQNLWPFGYNQRFTFLKACRDCFDNEAFLDLVVAMSDDLIRPLSMEEIS
jgi:hypothetical protein